MIAVTLRLRFVARVNKHANGLGLTVFTSTFTRMLGCKNYIFNLPLTLLTFLFESFLLVGEEHPRNMYTSLIIIILCTYMHDYRSE